MRILFNLTLFLSVLIFSSCGDGKPDIDDLEKSFQELVQKESEGRLSVKSIEKINAKDNQLFGQKFHSIQFKADMKVEQNCFLYQNKSGIGPILLNFKTYNEQPEFIPSFNSVVTKVSKDDEFEYMGEWTYEETENGWQSVSDPFR